MRKPRHRNSTRDREKVELSTLRKLVPELQAHVAMLSSRHQVPSTSAWRCFSQRQARARQAAERTNRALNDRVQSNADWILRLWELLHEKRRAADASTLKSVAALQQEAEDDMMLRHLKQQAELAVPQLPTVFAANGVSCVGGNDNSTDVWSHVQTGDLQSTLVCVRRVPFDMHSTSMAIWTALSCPETSFAAENSDEVLRVHVLERTPSVCKMKFQGCFRDTSGELVPLNYHAVVQRTEMAERPERTNVFVWQSFCELPDTSIKHHETMWLAVTRCPSGALESIVTVVCQSRVENMTELNDTDGLQGAVMSATDACIGSILSSADDILIRESLNTVSHTSRSIDEYLMHSSDV